MSVDVPVGRSGAEPAIVDGGTGPGRAAPAGWPDDVLRATGRVSAAAPPFTPPSRIRPGARRRLPDGGGSGPRSRPPRDLLPPWPGRVPAPSPASVPPEPRPARLLDVAGEPVGLAAPDRLTADPHRVAADGGPDRDVVGWAGPWPVEPRWWVGGRQAAGSAARPCQQAAESAARPCKQAARMQVALDGGAALLLLHRDGRWWVTGVYD